MKARTLLVALAAAICMTAQGAAPEPLPAAWFIAGPQPQKFAAGIDQEAGSQGAKFLRNQAGDPKAAATLMQQISARQYAGQRVRFRAFVKTRDVSGWAGLWMRVDSQSGRILAFYNSVDRPIKGSADWQERSVVLDVPQEGAVISFGVINVGRGQVWIDRLGFEQVGQEVPVDAIKPVPALPAVPVL